MSKAKRYFIDSCRDEHGFMRATDCVQSHEDTLRANSIEVIESQPVLERILILEEQLKAAKHILHLIRGRVFGQRYNDQDVLLTRIREDIDRYIEMHEPERGGGK